MKIWNTAGKIIDWLQRHSPTHEDGGVDEINLGGLSGDPADTINESLLTTQDDIIVRGASIAERLNITEQTLAGRLTGGNVSAVALGISDNNVAQIDGTSNAPANLDYAKFTTSGLEGKSYQELVNDISGVIKGTDVEVSELSSATYDDVQDYINFFGDRTFLTGCAITPTSPADGTVAVASGTAWCKESDSNTAVGKFFNFTGEAAIVLTDMVANLLYLDYNAGTPDVVVATSALTYGFQQDHILLGAVFRNGTETHILQADPIGIGGDNRSHMMRVQEGAARTSGMVTTATGTRNLAITAGVLHLGLNRKTTPPYTTPNAGTADATSAGELRDADGGFVETDVGKIVHDTTGGGYTEITAYTSSGILSVRDDIFVDTDTYDLDIFSYWYISAAGPTWTEVKGSTAINNTQYNLTTDPWGLATLSAAAKYGVHWVYMDFDGHLHVVYGQGDYFANQAEEASVPASLPNIATNFSVLIAKIIIQKDQATMTITYPWTEAFLSSLATDHGSLGGLADDDHTQYIKDSEFTADEDVLVGTGAGTFTPVNLTEQTLLGRITAGNAAALSIAQVKTLLGAGAASGLATLDANTKVVEQPASITDHLDDTEHGTDAETSKAPTSNRLYDHDVATTGVHGAGANTIATDDDISTHAALTATHGVTGAIVGTTDTQSLSNKTLGGDLTINGKYLDCGAGYFNVKTTQAGGLAIFRTINDGVFGTWCQFRHESANPAVNDYQRFQWYHRDGAGAIIEWANITHLITNIGNGTEASDIEFWAHAAGAKALAAKLTGAGTLNLGGNLLLPTGYAELTEIVAPGAGAANTVRSYAHEIAGNGGLTEHCDVFQDGTVIVLAAETTPLDSPIFTQPSGVGVKEKMIKPHPGLIQFVKVYPDGKTFVTRRIEYHDAEKIAANKGCEGPLPNGWEVTTLQQRVDKNVAELDERLAVIPNSIARLDTELSTNANRLKTMKATTDKEIEARNMVKEKQASIYQDKKQIEKGQAELEAKKRLELERLEE